MKAHMTTHDDDLKTFEAHGAAALPSPDEQGHLDHDGARIWYSSHGSGPPVIMLHGGLGHSGNWGYQVPALLDAGYRVVLIDSRGHGLSTRDAQPYTYELLASDVLAIMDALKLEQATVVGSSDGACTGLIMAMTAPARVAGVFYFACNMDPSGAREFQPTETLDRCFHRHAADYARLSATPDQFNAFVESVGLMQRTQPTLRPSPAARTVQRRAADVSRAGDQSGQIGGSSITSHGGDFAPTARTSRSYNVARSAGLKTLSRSSSTSLSRA